MNHVIKILIDSFCCQEYIDSWVRFDETSLPDKEAFYSSLNMEGITSVDYRHAKRVYKGFKLKNLGNYHDLYVQSDTLLLADVFENFRNKCIEIYELDPAHFLSAPWQACLKKAGVKLELLTDIDMSLIVEKGIRRGICQVIHKYAKANNKYLKNFDKNTESSSYLMYLDANNQYGWPMSQKLPVNGFEWVKKLSKFDEHFIKNYDVNSDKGYFLEVDVEYPKDLFSIHSDLPFLPERKEIEKCNKLIYDFHDKENYVIKALKQALNHGLILKEVHRVVQFNHKAWLEPYINMNSELRKEAKNGFEKDFFG